MTFTAAIYRLDAYYATWLESSQRDDVALDFTVDTAAKALELAPPERLALLEPDQQGGVLHLRELHKRATTGASWDQPSRLAWLEAALGLLKRLR